MGIGHTLIRLGILNPLAIHDETIFIFAGAKHQADHPLSGFGLNQRGGLWTPVIKCAGRLHIAGGRRNKFEHDLLFLQSGEPLRNWLI